MLRKYTNKYYLREKRRKLRRKTWQLLKGMVSKRFAYSAEAGLQQGYRAFREAKQTYRFFGGPEQTGVRLTATQVSDDHNALARLEYHCLPDGHAVQDGVLQPGTREQTGLVICCAFRGRHTVLDLVIREALAAQNSTDLRWLLCGSTPEDWDFIQRWHQRDPRVSGIITRNDPLGQKWQTVVATAHQIYDAGRIGITGSDDVLTAGLVDHVLTRGPLQPGQSPLMGCFEWLTYSRRPLPQFYHCQYHTTRLVQPLGAGRFYDGAFVDALGGRIFDSTRPNGLDDRGFSEVISRGYGADCYHPENHGLISVKGTWEQLNSLEAVLRTNTVIITEYSFAAYTHLRAQMSPEGFRQMIDFDFRT